MPRSNDRSFNKPIIFLAFAQDRQDSVYYLRNLPEEFRQVRAALQQKMEPDSAALTWQSINALLAPDTMKAAFAERWFSPALNFHNGAINSVAFSPDGKTLASGSDDQTIRLWDLYLYFVVFLKDGKPTQLFFAFAKGAEFFWQVKQEGLKFKRNVTPTLYPQDGYYFKYDPQFRPLLNALKAGQSKFDQILEWAQQQVE